MIRIYQEAYTNDECFHLDPKHIIPDLMERMIETIAIRAQKPECEFIIATNEVSTRVVGWLALAFKHDKRKNLSEEHVLLSQYALLPDIAAKAMSQGIGTDEIKTAAHTVFRELKEARQKQLPGKHCIISTLVVDQKFQRKGVASALLSKAIAGCEVFAYPIWVQVPAAYSALFEIHLFDEVGEYEIDLDTFAKTGGKGKKTAVPAIGKYSWKFMLRKEPLNQAIRAFQLSKVFEELEAERVESKSVNSELVEADQRAKGRWFWKGKERANADQKAKDKRVGKIEEPAHGWRGSEANAEEEEAEINSTRPLLGAEEQSASAESLYAQSHPEAGPSTPLLVELSSKGGQEL